MCERGREGERGSEREREPCLTKREREIFDPERERCLAERERFDPDRERQRERNV